MKDIMYNLDFYNLKKLIKSIGYKVSVNIDKLFEILAKSQKFCKGLSEK
jgi:hypothetical protein